MVCVYSLEDLILDVLLVVDHDFLTSKIGVRPAGFFFEKLRSLIFHCTGVVLTYLLTTYLRIPLPDSDDGDFDAGIEVQCLAAIPVA